VIDQSAARHGPRAGILCIFAAAVLGLMLAAAVAPAQSATRIAPCAGSPSQTPSSVTESESLAITATNYRTGCIGLVVTGVRAVSVSIEEVVPQPPASVPIATLPVHGGRAAPADGVPWSCERTTRTFQVTETLPDGTSGSAQTSITTPSCAGRILARAQARRLHSGFPLAIRLSDLWHLGGLRVRGCLAVAGPSDCAATTIAPGDTSAELRLRSRGHGRLVVAVKDKYETVKMRLRVLSSRPLLLATGDSEMQVLDEMLGTDLSGEGVQVVGDARQSTAISSPFFFNWPVHAFAQVTGERPDIVAMFLGGNEGFRLGHAECCGAAWSSEYAVRVEDMMRTYLQNGAAAVYWFLVPTPSSEPFVRVIRAVDRAIVTAAAHFHEGVHVFDLRPVFSPGGRYIDSLTRDGRTITVHESDGFHLSAAADVIVARMFIARLREDGLLR
jgi:hypothetical protein